MFGIFWILGVYKNKDKKLLTYRMKSITIKSTKDKRNEALQDKENLFLGGKK